MNAAAESWIAFTILVERAVMKIEKEQTLTDDEKEAITWMCKGKVEKILDVVKESLGK